jgi:NAD(P)H-hydrate epimerase
MESDPVLTRAQARELDRLALEAGIPGRLLMENAGGGAARFILDLLAADSARPPVGILCGGGNNGGDGYVVARHLHEAGVKVRVWEWSTVDALPPDAAVNASCLHGTAIERRRLPRGDGANGLRRDLGTCGLLVDALLGTGFEGDVRPDLRAVLDEVVASGVSVLALDVPSGLDADSGRAAPGTPRASWTVTFAALKPALVAPGPNVGEVHCVPLGVPPEVLAAAQI